MKKIIKKIFNKEPQEAEHDFSYFQKTLRNNDIEYLKRKYPDKDWHELLDRLADMQAEMALLRGKLQKKENLERQEEEEELLRYLKDYELMKKYDKDQRIVYVPFYFPKKSKKFLNLTVLSKNNTFFKGPDGLPYPYLRGFALEETEYSEDMGPFIYLILGRKKKYSDKQVMLLSVGYPSSLPYVIRDFSKVVKQTKYVGHVVLELDEDGKHPPFFVDIPAKPAIREFSDGIRKMFRVDIFKLKEEGRLSDEAIKIISGLYDQVQRMAFELSKSKQSEKEAIAQRMNAELTLQSYKPIIEMTPAYMQHLQEKCDKYVEGLMKYKTAFAENDQKRIMLEIMHRTMMDSFKDIVRKYTNEISKDDLQRASDKIWESTNQALDMVDKVANNIKNLMIPSKNQPASSAIPKKSMPEEQSQEGESNG